MKRLEKDGLPIAEETLRQIAELNTVEKSVRGLPGTNSLRRSSRPSGPGSRRGCHAFRVRPNLPRTAAFPARCARCSTAIPEAASTTSCPETSRPRQAAPRKGAPGRLFQFVKRGENSNA
ncbi:hypothetical protein K3555_16250 [Leisingera sp. M527]|uniref:hypothetical protein n=1 Tax=Leisingera sp. M527 TaxID=2867014 RepID=UPI00220E168E|nr:hypothetical protein K3555_16250 [Leisingera sp. M527]